MDALDQRIDEIIKELRLLGDDGSVKSGAWITLAERLNREDLSAPDGGPWTKGSVFNHFRQRIQPILNAERRRAAGDRTGADESAGNSDEDTVEVHFEDTTVDLLCSAFDDTVSRKGIRDEDELFEEAPPATPPTAGKMRAPECEAPRIRWEVLEEMVEWWMDNRDLVAGRERVCFRPRFPGPKRTARVQIQEALYDAALKKTSQPEERLRIGGDFSNLIEFLLWEYLDRDKKFTDLS